MTIDLLDASARQLRRQQAVRLKQLREQERRNASAQGRLFREVVGHEQLREQLKRQEQQDAEAAIEAALLEERVQAHLSQLGDAQREAAIAARRAHAQRLQSQQAQLQFDRRQQERYALAARHAREQHAAAHASTANFRSRRQRLLAAAREQAQLFTSLQQLAGKEQAAVAAAEADKALATRRGRPLQLDFKCTRFHERLPTDLPTSISKPLMQCDGSDGSSMAPARHGSPLPTISALSPSVPDPAVQARATTDT